MGEHLNKRGPGVMARPHVTPTKISLKSQKAANPDRRGGKRVLKVQPCGYQLAQVAGYEIVELSDGPALSLNSSKGGFLLLMPQSPENRQVFELHTSLSTEDRTVRLVEACWTRGLSFGGVGKVYLVGVKSLFEPSRFN